MGWSNLLWMAFIFFATTSFGSQTIKINAKKAVKFEVDTNVLKTIDGEGADLLGDVISDGSVVSGQFKVDLRQFKTGDEARDEHFKEMVNVKKDPYAYLELDKLPYKDGKFPFKGKLKLNDVIKEISGAAQKDGKKIKVAFKIDKKDFKLKIPDPETIKEKAGAALGVKVDDEISIEVNFTY